MLAGVFLFERPAMQMFVHQVLTILTIVYISTDSRMFETRGQKCAEIVSEMLLLLASLFIQELIRDQPSDEAKRKVEFAVLMTIGLLIIFNIVYVTHTVCINRKEKKRVNMLKKKQKEALETAAALKKQNPGHKKPAIAAPAPVSV